MKIDRLWNAVIRNSKLSSNQRQNNEELILLNQQFYTS